MSCFTKSASCIRPPTAMIFALLCSRASLAVSMLQTSAARMPFTLFAAICSPLPEPPKTIPRDSGFLATASAQGMQKSGQSSRASYSYGP
ncbi:hypothetical protein FGO68_gene15535 [Halteria grandinella]|uniref:Secreted protein n=1 Tax=Halteria grandinella TaxID=5974 RepID=A0A8J8N9L6_HALGN|nr:hypothetical protein FGO68_gene15535 [Halteria grandinella]